MVPVLELDELFTYLPAGKVSMPGGGPYFNIVKVEDLALPLRGKATYSRRKYFKLSLVAGHSKIHYPDHIVEIRDTALVFTHPMIPYRWERISEKQSGFVCIFSNDFLERFGPAGDFPVYQSAENGVILLNAAQFEFFKQMIFIMITELSGDYHHKFDLLRCQLMGLIHQGQKFIHDSHSPLSGYSANERITIAFTELLERQLPIEENRQVVTLSTPKDFAAALHLHINHLNKALKAVTGRTTSDWINASLTTQARRLLQDTNWPIAEIAWSLGFLEPQHFSALFKRLTGQTPSEYRKHSID